MTNRSISAHEELELESSEWTLRLPPRSPGSREMSKLDLEAEVGAVGVEEEAAPLLLLLLLIRTPEVEAEGVDSRIFLTGGSRESAEADPSLSLPVLPPPPPPPPPAPAPAPAPPSSIPFLREVIDGYRAALGERFGESREKWTGERILVDSEGGSCWFGRREI